MACDTYEERRKAISHVSYCRTYPVPRQQNESEPAYYHLKTVYMLKLKLNIERVT